MSGCGVGTWFVAVIVPHQNTVIRTNDQICGPCGVNLNRGNATTGNGTDYGAGYVDGEAEVEGFS